MLAKLQKQFASDIVEKRANGTYIPNDDFSSAELMQLYSNNYYLSLLEALSITYPTVIKLVGEKFFNFVGKKFIKSNPSQDGDLTRYGDKFAQFLKTAPECTNLPYLGDIAKLEWAFEMAYNAKDTGQQDLRILSALEQDKYNQLKFRLTPSCFLVKSNYPIFDIWQFDGNGELNINSGGQTILVWKNDFEVLTEIINDDLYKFLKNIKAGMNFGESILNIKNLDLEPTLKLLIDQKIIENLYLEN